MFAHQVIGDLKSQYLKLSQKEQENHYMMGVAYGDMIPSAIKFHFGDAHIILNSSKNDTHVFICNETPIKMPYPIMWFDYNNLYYGGQSCKVAALVCHYGAEEGFIEQYELFSFIFNPYQRKWVINPQVYFVKNGFMEKYNEVSGFSSTDDQIHHEIASACAWLAHKSILLLNCKNIKTENIKAPVSLNKKRRKNGKQEIFNYHVLNVVVPSNNKRGYQEKSTPLSHNRVHLCRGHFKEYTAEHPLFGKYTGLYWWQPAVRGQNKNGIVMKDYEIKTTN